MVRVTQHYEYRVKITYNRRTYIGQLFVHHQLRVKVPLTDPKAPNRGIGIALLFLDLSARRGGLSAPRPGRFTPGKDPVHILQEAEWAPGPV
jgi:hypothetical protein